MDNADLFFLLLVAIAFGILWYFNGWGINCQFHGGTQYDLGSNLVVEPYCYSGGCVNETVITPHDYVCTYPVKPVVGVPFG